MTTTCPHCSQQVALAETKTGTCTQCNSLVVYHPDTGKVAAFDLRPLPSGHLYAQLVAERIEDTEVSP
jgi:DNA-directed RNA polymerase subunit RPC12/RpoP